MFGIEKDFQNLMEQVYGPLNKDKEPPDTIEIGGVKYKRIEEPQSFYDKLWRLLRTKIDNPVECSEMGDRVRDLIREHIPEPIENKFMSEYLCGYNEAIREVKNNLQLDT